MLYPAHSRVGRGNLVLRHSVPNFSLNSGSVACVGTQRRTEAKRRNGNIYVNIINISFPRMGIEPTTSRDSHFVSLRHDWPL